MAACLKDWIMSADNSEDEEKVLLGYGRNVWGDW
jgi:hypothetical protein